MDTEVNNSVKATDRDAQYDESAKRLLGQKIILAHILVKTVDEFKGMEPKEIFPLLKDNHTLVQFQWSRDLRIRAAKRKERELSALILKMQKLMLCYQKNLRQMRN